MHPTWRLFCFVAVASSADCVAGVGRTGVRYPKTVEEFKKEGGVFQPKTEG